MKAVREKGHNENPLSKANCINKFFFWWLKDIIWYGAKNEITFNNIYDTMPEDSCEPLLRTLATAWEKEMDYTKSKSMKPSLLRVIVKTYYLTFLKYASLHILYLISLLIQPLSMEMIMLYFDSTSRMSSSKAYACATAFIVLLAVQSIVFRHSHFLMNRLGMQIKVAVSFLIYKKFTKLPCSFVNRNESPSAMNLLSTDVNRFEKLLMFLPFVFILPFQLAGVMYFAYTFIGWIASLTGVALMILQTFPSQMLYYNLTPKWRAKQTASADKRLSLIEEVVAGVRAIKMYAWENYFEKLARNARSFEIQSFLKIAYVTAVNVSQLMITHRVCSFVATLVYFMQYRMITPEKALPVRQYLFSLNSNINLYFLMALQEFTNTRVSIERIQEFLCSPEIRTSIKKMDKEDVSVSISIDNVTASWDEKLENTTLHNITVDFSPRNLYTVIGKTGSGKSSLLKLILGELEPISGQVSVAGKISYASQEPWLFNASVRENILFGETYEMERYNEVVSACALVDDFNDLPYGDQTLVADRGISLSGGQRARINLARAVYRQADIYLLDDPLSAVDTRVAETLKSQCIDGLLKDKTVILVTHNVHHLGENDHIVLLESGRIQLKGSVAHCRQNDELLHLLSIGETHCSSSTIESYSYEKNVQASPLDFPNDGNNRASNQNEETMAKGSLSVSVFLKYVRAGGIIGFLTVIAFHILLSGLRFKFDFDTTAWAETESHILKNQTLEHKSNFDQKSAVFSLGDIEIPTIVIDSFSILAVMLVVAIIKNVLIYRFIYKANTNLHNGMFAQIIRTPLSFFDLNPAGRIFNRFSEDVGNLDNVLPKQLVDLGEMIFLILGSLTFILIMNWWHLVPISLTIIIFICSAHFYVSAITKMRRIVGIAKSPMLSFVVSTLAGLTTIRSCKAENFISKEFARRLDKHTAAFFLALASTMGFAVWIELLSVGLLSCTAYICIALKNHGVLGGEVGLTLTVICEMINALAFGLRVLADTYVNMVSVERILQYTELKPENFDESESRNQMSESWPSTGHIRFESVNLRYHDDSEPVLKDLSFTVEPATKIGIVGRTGAGKSSLISSLFRLVKAKGQIFIDNVDTQKVDLSHLRSKISIIPQEPILFSATLRSNLDPLSEFEDVALWSALDSVGLKNTFSSLDQMIEKAGRGLSLGQRQLLCLARVTLKNNKILVLDEATASVDSATDAIIQKTIREKFKSCTVLTIAHRLNTIMDSDKILVLDQGLVVEYDHPHVLLQNRDGHFSKMVEQTGEVISQQLSAVAEHAYNYSKIEVTHC